METTLTLLVLTAVIGLSQQLIPRCPLSRLDNVPCKKLDPRIRNASENKCVVSSEMIFTLGAHAQRGYCSWVCLCVCYSQSHFSNVCSSHKR
ncbi:hypothetical protein GBAR_LOCUS15632, partial [Geodia barretti]